MRSGIVMTTLAVLIFSAGMASARAAEDYGPLNVQKTSMGNVLADPNGMTLYTFDKDTPGKSACTGECAVHWPPMKAAADAKATGGLTVITRDDGTKQWADDGKPLYTFMKDKKPGDVMGDSIPGWHAVKE
jgi:predicted lipoprotein with Yx(FWY)xxD motif